MWMLLTVSALAAEPGCEWQSAAQAFGTRDIAVGGAKASLTYWVDESAVTAKSRLVIEDEPRLRTTFTSPNVVIHAVLGLDDDHPMTLVGETLRYGTFGNVPPGASVHITRAGANSVTVLPSSVQVCEVHFEGAEREVHCDSLAPGPPSYLSETATPQEEPPDRSTSFDMERQFELSRDPGIDDEVVVRPLRWFGDFGR